MHLVPHGRHVQAALVAHFQYVAVHPKVIGVARGEEARSGRAAEHLHVRLVQADSTEGEFVDVVRLILSAHEPCVAIAEVIDQDHDGVQRAAGGHGGGRQRVLR